MSMRAQLRGDTAAVLATRNEVLLEKELCFETDTGLYKIGNGVTAWNALPYYQLTPVFAGPVTLDAVANPSPPAAGRMHLYAHSVAGRMFVKIIEPSGLDNPLQSGLYANRTILLTPGAAAAFSVVGAAAPTIVGTLTHPVMVAGVDLRSATGRGLITSAATANAAAEARIAANTCYRGEIFATIASGGFFMTTRFGVETVVANQRVAVGLFNTTAALAATLVPSALVNCLIAGWDSADTSLQIMHNDAAGTCTKIALGANFPVNTPAAMYEVAFFCAPNGDAVGYRVVRLDTGVVASGSITTDLPAKATLLSWHAFANNGGTAASVLLGISRAYIDTDY
jgi:Major tropism determinant N-terminal domain